MTKKSRFKTKISRIEIFFVGMALNSGWVGRWNHGLCAGLCCAVCGGFCCAECARYIRETIVVDHFQLLRETVG